MTNINDGIRDMLKENNGSVRTVANLLFFERKIAVKTLRKVRSLIYEILIDHNDENIELSEKQKGILDEIESLVSEWKHVKE